MREYIMLLGLFAGIIVGTHGLPEKPHIILIVADDLGWKDVSWNGANVNMPKLNSLASNGVILNNSYVYPSCTPSRAALLTGKYTFHLGMKNKPLGHEEAGGLPLTHKLLPQMLKNQSYHTHMVGKWHLGFCKDDYTPTHRGFDSSFGIYGGMADYYTQSTKNIHDFSWNNTAFYPSANGYSEYTTFASSERAVKIIKDHNTATPDEPMFLYLPFQAPHSPNQVPDGYVEELTNDTDRNIHLGMISALDKAVDDIVTALEDTNMLDNAVIIFTSDNGGTSNYGGYNYPLRGQKGTFWEGGIRVPGFVYSKTLLDTTGYVFSGLIHISDWLPTLLGLAEGDTPDGIDGKDQWNAISNNVVSSRKIALTIPVEADDNLSVIRNERYKLILGSPGKDLIYEDPKRRRKRSRTNAYLFDLINDPTESFNLFNNDTYRDVKRELKQEIQALNSTVVSLVTVSATASAFDMAQGNGYWGPGWC